MIRARIIAVKTEERNLKPGDLFSDKGPEYWNKLMSGDGLGATSVMIKTNAEVDFSPNASVFRLTVVREDTETGYTEREVHMVRQGFDPSKPPGAHDV